MKIKVNTRLLPIKANFFFFWGGLAGVMPYLSVIAKNLGISASAVSLIAALFPLISVVAKPFFGSVADRYQKLKLMMLLFLPPTAIAYLGVIFLRPIEVPLVPNILICSNFGSELGLSQQYTNNCIRSLELSNATSNVEASCVPCFKINQTGAHDYSDVLPQELNCSAGSKTVFEFTLTSETVIKNKVNVWFPLFNVTNRDDLQCDSPQLFQCQTDYPRSLKQSCHVPESEKSVFLSSQFWIFLILFILSRTGSSVLISLSDTACFNMLEGQYNKYGQQRLWGAVGWGVFSLINMYVSSTQNNHDLSLGFYLMVSALFLNLIVVFFADIRSTHSRGQIAKNIAVVLKNAEVLIFLTGVLAMGILTGIFWTYLFWFLADLGASTMQMGSVLAVQCFLGELPFFFIAGWVINKIGNRNALTIALGAFGVRFLAYSYLTDPWYVLPIELTQGLTFGLFYTLMTTYAKAVTPPGTEATIQGLVGGTFEGLGLAIGGLAGLGFDKLGQRTTFKVVSIFAFTCCFLHICAHLVFKFRKFHTSPTAGAKNRLEGEEETSFLPNNSNTVSKVHS